MPDYNITNMQAKSRLKQYGVVWIALRFIVEKVFFKQYV